MAGYFIATIRDVKDPDSLRQYRRVAAPLVRQYGGEIVATEKDSQQFVEGEQGVGVVVIWFPSYDHAIAWYNSSEYQKARELRLGAVEVHAVLLRNIRHRQPPHQFQACRAIGHAVLDDLKARQRHTELLAQFEVFHRL